jgi:integrase
MPRYKEPFTLYTRTNASGKEVYYYRTYDENGKRTTGISTGLISRPAAKLFCMNLYKEGKLVPKQTETFADFSEDFWVWDKCTYILRCNNLKKDKKSVSREHARTERGYLVNHIQPYFDKRKLTSIKKEDIEDFIIYLRKNKPLAAGSVNHIIKIVKIMTAEALRRKLIYEDPSKEISYIDADEKERGILTLDEVAKLLHPGSMNIYWEGCIITYAMNVLAAVTGMRRGELLGLLNKNVHPGHILVSKSFGAITGIKHQTKGLDDRHSPISPDVYKLLQRVMEGGPEGYTFSFHNGTKHYPENRILPNFKSALIRMGISEEERKERNIVFHSWRHTFNTILLLKKITVPKIQAVVGHKDNRMTDNYSHFQLQDFNDVLDVQAEIFQGELS